MNKYRECPKCIAGFKPPVLCDGGEGCHAVAHGCPHRQHPKGPDGKPLPMVHRFCSREGCDHYRTDHLHTAPVVGHHGT